MNMDKRVTDADAALEGLKDGMTLMAGGFGCLLYTSDAADGRSSGDFGGGRVIEKKTQERQSIVTKHT